MGATADEVEAAVGDGSAWGMSVTYIRQEAPLGLAHAVLTAKDFVASEPFVMYLGDNVLLEGIGRFVEEYERHLPNAQIFLARVPEPERFGVAVLDGDRVVRLVEKPREHVSRPRARRRVPVRRRDPRGGGGDRAIVRAASSRSLMRSSG